MEINFSGDGDTLIVSIRGKVDTIAAGEFQKKLEDALGPGVNRIVLDMHDMAYISSAGLRSVLVLCKKAQSNDVGLVCCGLNNMVQKIFTVSGFSQLIKVVETLDDARG